MSTDEPAFRWRTMAAPVFVPSTLFVIGEGAILPVIPALAGRVGADLAGAGLVAGMVVVGVLLGDIPAGWIVGRLGERATMLGASALAATGVLLAIIAPNAVALGAAMAMIGFAAAVFGLARHALLTSVVPAAFRARALSTLGGSFRLGLLIGPFVAAGVIALTGELTSVLWFSLVMCAVVAASILLLPDPEGMLHHRSTPEGAELGLGAVFRTIAARRSVLARLGVSALTIAATRSARQVILPLWAASIGLGGGETALIIGVAGGVDFALFYLGGWLMDRFGRLYTAVPSMIGLGLGLIGLALSAGSSDPVAWFVAVALWLSLANGIGAGVVMTMGSDLAGRENPAPFLSAWRFTMDAGGASAPLLLSAITAVASLSVAAAALGVVGLGGAVLLARYIPRQLPRDEG
ncbi:MFS transporter [Yonghaparkia sp. Soil809]|uniref:MFS transporter n=1 Tax=Yonghaparkia sp. Soil809 TaxID=1736417 RepID=UPI0006FE7C7D|nr:MFS transporter [Yonghaparkia sp. Soil809]KRF32648.1 MFS transporter [Yonghaparkia sp. Soil809]